MRYDETGLVDLGATEPEDVEIERPGSPPLTTLPTRRSFGVQQPIEQLAGRVTGVHHRHRVEIGPLIGATDGIGLVQGRDRDEIARPRQGTDTGGEMVRPVAQVRPETDGGAGRQVPAASGMMARASGPSGRFRISWIAAVARMASSMSPE